MGLLGFGGLKGFEVQCLENPTASEASDARDVGTCAALGPWAYGPRS